jgi:hypothetical protein
MVVVGLGREARGYQFKLEPDSKMVHVATNFGVRNALDFPEPIFLDDFKAIFPRYTWGISAKYPRVPQGVAFSYFLWILAMPRVKSQIP